MIEGPRDVQKQQQLGHKFSAVSGWNLSPFANFIVSTSSERCCNLFHVSRRRVGCGKSLNQTKCDKWCCIIMVEVVILPNVELREGGDIIHASDMIVRM